MLTVHTYTGSDGRVTIFEETKEGKVRVRGIRGDELKQYITFSNPEAIPFFIEQLQVFYAKYKENNTTPSQEPLRRIEIEPDA